jgi:hypothetical protein
LTQRFARLHQGVLIGRWRIAEADLWDHDPLDIVKTKRATSSAAC